MKKHKEFLLLCFEAAVAAGSAGIVALFRAAKQATPATLAAFKNAACERVFARFNEMMDAELKEIKAFITEREESV